MNSGIDIVILWVDGNDENWLQEKNKYDVKRDNSKDKARYRDWDVLKYWFRGVEKYLPWIRKIHFVTWGHLPEWINTNNPKLEIVNHKDFIPEKYLPTFSSTSIELNIHRIKGLSENFIYFNDDMFVLQPMKEQDFFVNGFPCESAIMNTISNVPGWEIECAIQFNNAGIINKYFNKKNVIKNNINKWYSLSYGKQLYKNLVLLPWPYFTGFATNHLPSSMKKSTFEEVWEKEYNSLDKMCMHKFRYKGTVNQFLMSNWQVCSGKFVPRNPKIGTSVSLTNDADNNKRIYDMITHHSYKMMCINDYIYDVNYEETKKLLKLSFDRVLGTKSSYER